MFALFTKNQLQKLVTPSEEMTLAMKTILRDSHENSNSSKSENTSSSYVSSSYTFHQQTLPSMYVTLVNLLSQLKINPVD